MSEESPLARYLVPLRRWWPIVAGAVALGLVVGWFTLPDPPDRPERQQITDPTVEYRATHILMRDRVTSATSNFDLMLLLAGQGDITNRVASRMGDRVELSDIQRVSLDTDDKLGTVSITAVHGNPELASELATSYAEEFTAYFDDRDEQGLQEEIDRTTRRLAELDLVIRDLQDRIEDLPPDDLDRRLLESQLDVLIGQFGPLQAQLQDLNSERASARSTFETLEVPSPIAAAARPGPVFEVPEDSRARVGLAALVALLLGIAIVFAIDYLDTRVRTRPDAEDAFRLPVIAELPHRSKRQRQKQPLPVRTDPGSATAEGFRSLRLAVALSPRWRLDRSAPTGNGTGTGVSAVMASGELKTLLVTSSLTGEGKSTVVANLATSFAESGQRVLVIDCDFRRSSVAELLGAPHGRGLRDLADPRAGDLESLIVPSDVPGVVVLPSGGSGLAPPWFLAESATIVERADGLADVVILDTGPIMGTSEAASLVPAVDAVLLVGRAGRLRKDEAKRTTEQLTRLSAEVAGIVLVGADGQRRYSYYEPIRKASETGGSIQAWTAGGRRQP